MKCRLLFGMILSLLCSCSVHDRILPEPEIDLYPAIGDSLTVFLFDASGSRDNFTDPFYLKVRWDAESDGIWETGWNISKKFSWRYPFNGSYLVTCESMDEDGNIGTETRQVGVRKMYQDSSFTDRRDGRTYRAALINDLWWMSVNLEYGIPVEENVIPKIDGRTEYYKDPEARFGGYYLWQEVTLDLKDTVRGICPEGWRLPGIRDISKINELLYFQTSMDKYILDGGVLGLDLTKGGRFVRTAGQWEGQHMKSSYWVTNGSRPARFLTWMLYLPGSGNESLRILYEGDYGTGSIEGWPRDWGEFNYSKVALPVRCVKDFR